MGPSWRRDRLPATEGAIWGQPGPWNPAGSPVVNSDVEEGRTPGVEPESDGIGADRERGASADEFRRFAEARSASLLKVAFALLADGPSAEDAAQTALMRTFRHWRRARDNPAGYAWRVLVNVCRDEHRRRRRAPVTLAASVEDALALEGPRAEALVSRVPPSGSPDGVADRRDLVAAVRLLPYRQREVLVLRFLLDMTVAETAELLAVPEGTVKSATSRTLAQLRHALSPTNLEVHHADR